MKRLTIAALIGAQIATVQPALATDFAATQPERIGAFGGVRVHVPLGGNPDQRQIRAGLAVTPTLQGAGERPLRIGEGVELGFRSGRPFALSVAGMDVRGAQLGAGQDQGTEGEAEEEGGGGPAWWLIVGGVVVVALGLTAYTANRILECERGCD